MDFSSWIGMGDQGNNSDLAARKALEALLETEQWYRMLLDHIQDGITIIQRGRVEFINERASQIYGLSREEYLEGIGLNLALPDEREKLQQVQLWLRGQGEAPEELEFWALRPDGQQRCINARFSDIHRGDNLYHLVVTADNTERRLAEDGLRASEERYRAVSELVSDYAYAYTVEPDGSLKPEWVTEAFSRITGFTTPDEIDSFGGLLSLIHMEDQSVAATLDQNIMSGEATVSEFRIIAKDGEVHWIRDYSQPLLDETNGKVVRIYGAAQDITTRKQAEEALHESEARNKAILDAIPDWIFRIHRKGMILDYRGGREQNLTDWQKVIVGNHVQEVFTPVTSAKILFNIQKAFDEGEVKPFEFMLNFPDGDRIFEASLVVSSKQDVLMFAHDISYRARLEKMKSDFINRASHELRTPLTGAILMSELIEQGGSKEEVDEYWFHLKNELNRQRALIERLLTVGRLETGRLKLVPQPTEIPSILKEALEAVYPLAKSREIVIETSIPDELPAVNGDTGGLDQVFTNLINNAVKFSRENSKVMITVRPKDDGVSVWVQDHGVGIPERDIPHLFEGFFRAQNAVEEGIPGSGVGLYIVKSVVIELGGWVTVNSVQNQGTTFEVWLPAA